jgi:hypothetical protein
MATPNVGRIDDTIKGLEKLHAVAQDIVTAHVRYACCKSPGVPAAVVEQCEITGPAGNTVNYIAALKIVRKSITGTN